MVFCVFLLSFYRYMVCCEDGFDATSYGLVVDSFVSSSVERLINDFRLTNFEYAIQDGVMDSALMFG